jgi:hypothetical protein
MMPIMMARELEVPVIGRSYSPAFLGWFSAMCYSFTWNSKSSSCTLGSQASVPATQGLGFLYLAGNSHAKLFFFPS